MASLVLNGNTSGSVTISSPAVSGTTTLTLPTTSGTVLTNGTNTNFPVGSVLQVVQVTKTDTFTTASTSFTDVTGLSASITPSSASNKIMVILYTVLSNTNTAANYYSQARLVRNSTAIFVGDAAGSRSQSAFFASSPNTNTTQAATVTFLDSPATTSSTTYKLQISTESGGTACIGRTSVDADNSTYGRFPSGIILMEIKG
jgi:peptidoglycan DL-endopeptidase CwlO